MPSTRLFTYVIYFENLERKQNMFIEALNMADAKAVAKVEATERHTSVLKVERW